MKPRGNGLLAKALLGALLAAAFLTGACRQDRQAGGAPRIGLPGDRADRLVPIRGHGGTDLLAELSADGGKSWRPATIYPGGSVDDWRSTEPGAWNESAAKGRVPAGETDCLWNPFFDVVDLSARVRLRLRREADNAVVEERAFAAGAFAAGRVLTSENLPLFLDGGALPKGWALAPSIREGTAFRNIVGLPDGGADEPLSLRPNLAGRYRIYIGLELPRALLLSVSGEGLVYPVPDYGAAPAGEGRDRLFQEVLFKSADLTGRTVSLAAGGARRPQPVSVRYIRFVPQTPAEAAAEARAIGLAEAQGRPFAAYLETVEGGFFHGPDSTLRGWLRNELRLHRARGATDAYVHVLRIGVKAWYHSEVIEREAFASDADLLDAARRTSRVFSQPLPEDTQSLGWEYSRRWTEWMAQGDPLAVAVEEGRAAGLRVFADVGMNVTHIIDAPWLTEKAVVAHPDWLSDHKMYLDYRKPGVRDYAAAIVAELLAKYDLDGINLDFARWGYNRAYDEDSLVEAMRRVQEVRGAAEEKWGHPVIIAVRIPSYAYASDAPWAAERYGGEHPWFTAALRTWAREGWVDRAMACTMSEKGLPLLSVKRYVEAVAGTRTRFWGDLYAVSGAAPGRSTSAYFLDIARRWTAEGLAGGFFFYAPFRPIELDRINWRLRLVDHPRVDAALDR